MSFWIRTLGRQKRLTVLSDKNIVGETTSFSLNAWQKENYQRHEFKFAGFIAKLMNTGRS
jgi:hypothetical protein